MLPESSSGQLISMAWRARGSVVSWADRPLGVPSCAAPPRTACGMSGFWIRQAIFEFHRGRCRSGGQIRIWTWGKNAIYCLWPKDKLESVPRGQYDRLSVTQTTKNNTVPGNRTEVFLCWAAPLRSGFPYSGSKQHTLDFPRRHLPQRDHEQRLPPHRP